MLELQRSGTLLQRLSKEETELVGCGESRTTVIILWCDRRDNVEWFLLECFRGGGRAEQLRTQDCGCLGDLASTVVQQDRWFLAGEIPGYPVEKDSETGRVYTSATGERVFDQGKQQILGTVDGKVRGLNMRVAASQEEPHECVRHVCGWTSCRVRFRRQQSRDLARVMRRTS